MMELEQYTIRQLKNMLNKSPYYIYENIFILKKITIRNKISIIAACLNDQKAIDNKSEDSCERNLKIQKAIDSLEKLITKKCI